LRYTSDIQLQKGWAMQRKSISRLLVFLICAGIFQTFPLHQSAYATPPKGSIEFTYTHGDTDSLLPN
jgi:hypothetical protein